jgi:transposase-like protein
LRGIAPPEWTRRPNAKDELRRQALELRAEGWSVNDLAGKLGVAKSTAYAWLKHLPLDPNSERASRKQAHAAPMNAAIPAFCGCFSGFSRCPDVLERH